MPLNLSPVDECLNRATPDICPAAQIAVRWRDRTRLDRAFGWLDVGIGRRPATPGTRFDLASITKLFVVTTFMTLVEDGRVEVDQPVSSVLPDFSGLRPIQPYEDPQRPGAFIAIDDVGTPVRAQAITFRHLLTHTSGLPAWRPLFRRPNAEAARRMALDTFFACQPDSRLIYSDIGLFLLGMAVERLSGQRLDRAVQDRLLDPLDMQQTGYIALDSDPAVAVPSNDDIAPTEYCAWRQRRIHGQVHDENAYRLGGVAGHAGIFSTAGDVVKLGQMYLNRGAPLLSQETVAEMTRLQAEEGFVRRGLGFVLWSPELETGAHTFSARAYGHTGFTGTSLWIDPDRDLVVALLTNEVYHGRSDRKIAQLRTDVHSAVITAVDAATEAL